MGGAVMMKTAAQISDEVLEKCASAWQRRAEAAGVAQPQIQQAQQYAKNWQVADPLANKARAIAANKPAPGLFSRLAGGFKKLPTWGKAGVGIGAALGAYGLGKHFLGGNDQPKQQYGQW
jgi:hypothetical protein